MCSFACLLGHSGSRGGGEELPAGPLLQVVALGRVHCEWQGGLGTGSLAEALLQLLGDCQARGRMEVVACALLFGGWFWVGVAMWRGCVHGMAELR